MVKHLAAAACVALGALPCWAGRPLATEDAGVLARGDCEVESFVAREHPTGAGVERSASVQLGCGVIEGTQAALQFQRAAGQPSQQSLALVGKTGLPRLADATTLALAWSASMVRQGGDAWQGEGVEAKAVLSHDVTSTWTLHANLGWAHDRALGQSQTHWALATEHHLSESLDLMGELFGHDRDRNPWTQLGLRWAAIADKLWLDASLGRQGGAHGSRALSLGLRVGF